MPTGVTQSERKQEKKRGLKLAAESAVRSEEGHRYGITYIAYRVETMNVGSWIALISSLRRSDRNKNTGGMTLGGKERRKVGYLDFCWAFNRLGGATSIKTSANDTGPLGCNSF